MLGDDAAVVDQEQVVSNAPKDRPTHKAAEEATESVEVVVDQGGSAASQENHDEQPPPSAPNAR